MTSHGTLPADTWASPACGGHPLPGDVQVLGDATGEHECPGTWCQAGDGRGVEVRVCSTALTSSALESHPVLLSLQGCSWALLGHTAGINCFKASVRVSVWRQQSTLDPAARKRSCRAAVDQCPHKLIQQLNLFSGRFSCSA